MEDINISGHFFRNDTYFPNVNDLQNGWVLEVKALENIHTNLNILTSNMSGTLNLVKDQTYILLDDTVKCMWKIHSKDGNQGYVPSNKVIKIESKFDLSINNNPIEISNSLTHTIIILLNFLIVILVISVHIILISMGYQ